MPSTGPFDPDSPGLVAGYRALNAFFDRILVITLRRAGARRAQLAHALTGLRYELIYGQDKQDLDLDALVARGVHDPVRARRLGRAGRPMTTGEVACALSHLEVWRQVAEGPHRRVLVFEDDVVPYPPGVARLGEALGELPSGWDFLYLGYDRNEEVTLHRRLKRLAYMALGGVGLHPLSAREASNLLPRPFTPRLRRAGLHDQAHAYGITPAAAARLLRLQQPVVLAADVAMSRLILRGELDAYLTEPKAFYQRGVDSFIRSIGIDERDVA